jgi:hypothetical protein
MKRPTKPTTIRVRNNSSTILAKRAGSCHGA